FSPESQPHAPSRVTRSDEESSLPAVDPWRPRPQPLLTRRSRVWLDGMSVAHCSPRLAVTRTATFRSNESTGVLIMRNHLLNKTTSLGAAVLGLLSAAAIGCGSDAIGKANGSDSSENTPSSVGITEQSLSVDGCGAIGTFGIFSPQIISNVALDQSA